MGSNDRSSLRRAVLAQRFANVDVNDISDLQKKHLKFALSTNARGLSSIKRLELNGVIFKGAKVLDIGCAYGGFTIEARRKGASVAYGVDIDEELLYLAEKNLEDEDDTFSSGCKFVHCDITNAEVFSLLPQNFFNVIIINDVFEHVYDTTRLLYTIGCLADYECTLYFQIPNGLHYFEYAECEPHKHLYGVSILDPLCWPNRAGLNIYYRRWEYFAALFTFFGYKNIEFFNQETKVAKEELNLLSKFEALENSLTEKLAKCDEDFIKSVKLKLRNFKNELLRDVVSMSGDELTFKYLTKFWEGIAKRK